MRFLRGKWFVLACCAALALGAAFGSGWLGPLLGLMDHPLESVGLKPPPVLRLTTAEHAEQEKRLAAAFGGQRPKTYAFVQLEPYLRVKSLLSCGDDPGPRAGQAITPSLSFSGVRQHGDGTTESIGKVFLDADVAQRFRFYAALKGKAYDE